VRYMEGDPLLAAAGVPSSDLAPAAMVEVADDRDFQFCTEFIVQGLQLPPSNEVRTVLHGFGGSVVVVSTGDLLKAHVHTDTPEAVFTTAAKWGEVTFTKADDMRAQHRALKHLDRRPVTIVSDSAADLADTILDRHRIAIVPLQVTFGDESFKDRVELRPADFYARLRTAKQLPTTSQPAPADFVKTFRSALEEADDVVAVLVSGVLSGTFNSAQTAARVAGLTRVSFVDSRSASLGEGMLALRGAELAESGWPAGEIVRELERVRGQSGFFLTVDTYENLLRSGRVSRGRAWLGGMLDVKPILTFDGEGKLVPTDRARGREAVFRRVLQLLDQRLTPRPKVVRFGIAHVEAAQVAERVKTALIAAFSPRDCFLSLASGVLGTHAGPGAWAVFYQVEDGTPERLPGRPGG
jgi:DegV family protein with EDD domain